MESSEPQFKKYLFVCENKRESGDCCATAGEQLRHMLRGKVKERGLTERIRVSRTGCLDVCSQGPNVLLMPDNVWFKKVRETDIEAILEKAAGGV